MDINKALIELSKTPCYRCGHALSDHAILTGCKHCKDYCHGVLNEELARKTTDVKPDKEFWDGENS